MTLEQCLNCSESLIGILDNTWHITCYNRRDVEWDCLYSREGKPHKMRLRQWENNKHRFERDKKEVQGYLSRCSACNEYIDISEPHIVSKKGRWHEECFKEAKNA